MLSITAIANATSAQTTTINGSSLAMRSSGAVVGSGLRLTQNGFAGTYITLSAPATLSLTVNASGVASGGASPRMNIVVGDDHFGFDVTATAGNYASPVISLPAGTHFIRTEFANDIAAASRQLTINNLQVSSAPAVVSNSNSDANALAAANTYIANYRKGDATVALPGAAPGTPVEVRLVDHAFKFGTAVPGTLTSSVNAFLGNNPAPGSTAANFQQRLLANFNSITPENAGKWANNASSATAPPSTGGIDRMMQYAEQNDLRVRMHTLLWGQQAPTYVNDLLAAAAGGNAAAKTTLSAEITERIGYYVGSRGSGYAQLDVLNESVHEPAFWNVYGAAGVASIYNETRDAIANSAQRPTLFTNEYNVIQDSSDTYANWYRQNVEAIREAGGAVGGIGVQYYPHNAVGSANNQHNAARMFGVLQNLSVAGLPIELTEVGVKPDGVGTTAQNQQRAAQILENSLRLAFGTPGVTGFTMWGIWAGSVWSGAPDGVLYNTDWSARPAGVMWEDLMSVDADGIDDDWDTEISLVVGADGTINFNGFYGQYEMLVGGETYSLDLRKGTTSYVVPVPEPASCFMAIAVASMLGLSSRTRRQH